MKNKTTTSVLALVLMCFSFVFVQAQNGNPVSEQNQKLMKNFLALMENSSSYQNYKVIDKERINGFQENLGSYLVQEQRSKQQVVSQLQQKDQAIKSLENQLSKLQTANESLLGSTESISFLGFKVNKATYSIIMWLLVLGSIAFSGILFLKYQRANEITTSSKSILKDLEDEYESFRRVCIQREQDLKRKLYDEMKKTDGLRNAS
ncbi:hypothetical protein [Flavobacterium okayamense]|uniref:tRNA (Guanine-N1)-methyltransferase n=1 Tax=Flavobacterium okayamense TaxID=2830782 RepID=A0ABM7S3B2_9FLAO|nr:hypothetical protein [Flavobacterium okayamense]BCY28036.1 hypothetical protein KK2020170_09040 [Flavobacterium okayamense]